MDRIDASDWLQPRLLEMGGGHVQRAESDRMTGEELKNARIALGYDQKTMYTLLKTPRRTYQDWESGKNPIPGVVEVAVRLLQERDKWLMQSITERVTAGYKG